MSELLEQIEKLKAQIESAQAMYVVTARQRDNAWLEVERLEDLIEKGERRLSEQTDFYQQRFNTLWTWVNSEVRPLSEDVANRYFSIVANGSPAPHERADWRDTLHGLTLRAEQAERRIKHLQEVVEDEAERDCGYGDGCPSNSGTRHGTCSPCKARRALLLSKESK